ncbi:MAG: hypothetical protein K2L96_03470 [Muribaculaceae bacterium]|nr:hypothetical protein [Muribaculaceae bacterium]
MTLMDCVNLLAFIQIAVAFDFGLLYLHNSHLLKSLHGDFIYGHRNRVEPTTCCACDILKDLKYKHGFSVKIRRGSLKRWVDRLTFLTDVQQANWSKYVYLGLCGGLYSLLSLVLIGVTGSSYDPEIRNFLLVSGEVFLVYEFFIVYQIGKVRTNGISVIPLVKKAILLIVIMGIVGVFVYNGWYFKFFSSFRKTYIVLLFSIVYFPIFVYLWKMWELNRNIAKAKKECERWIKDDSQ